MITSAIRSGRTGGAATETSPLSRRGHALRLPPAEISTSPNSPSATRSRWHYGRIGLSAIRARRRGPLTIPEFATAGAPAPKRSVRHVPHRPSQATSETILHHRCTICPHMAVSASPVVRPTGSPAGERCWRRRPASWESFNWQGSGGVFELRVYGWHLAGPRGRTDCGDQRVTRGAARSPTGAAGAPARADPESNRP